MLANKNPAENCNPSLFKSESSPTIPAIGNTQTDNTLKASWKAGKTSPGNIQFLFFC